MPWPNYVREWEGRLTMSSSQLVSWLQSHHKILFQKIMILMLLCHFQSDSKYQKEKNKKAHVSTKLVSQRRTGECGWYSFLFMQSMPPLVREGLQSIRLLRVPLWNLQGDNLSETEMERRKRSHPRNSFVIKDFPSCLIRWHRGDQLYN